MHKMKMIPSPARRKVGRALALFTILISTPLLSAAEKAFSMDANTIELWNFDEMSGTKASSDLSNGTTFSLKSTAPQPLEWATGKFGAALHFPGKVRLAANPVTLPLEQSVTVEAWIKVDESGSGARMGILQCMAYRKAGFRMEISEKRHVVWSIETEGKELSVTSKAFVYPGDWIHVAGTYDGTTLRVYVNGDLSGESTGPGGVLTASAAYLLIGYTDGSEMPYFYGLIDAIRISNTARKDFPKL